MKPIVLALFVLWLLSLEFYIYVPGLISVLLGAGFVSSASVTLLDWYYRRRSVSALRQSWSVDGDGSLGL
jgi:hypothetical protein